MCHNREEVSSLVSTRQARVPAPHLPAECEKSGPGARGFEQDPRLMQPLPHEGPEGDPHEGAVVA
ncbi:hypothetical protein SBA4_3240007 [Candidatus Sulfopaludibacter sp. SbA4]|nr:hypothetical protein SBA4_3240007 [Candidatus Sulfopaludibacter sp. SbA4]